MAAQFNRRRESFYQVLSAAIADLIEHGFDSQKRLDDWLHRLERAARSSLIPELTLRRELQQALTRVYDRVASVGKLSRLHLGVDQFTLRNVQPRLRQELDRRIAASANLIKLNREASVQRTLQRFAGWATSVPAGGTEVAEQREVARTVRRSLAGLPFEERRVIVDQGHKLTAAVNEIVATDGGAIAARWRHVRESGGYQARPVHVKRDSEIFVVRDNWALRQGLMKLGGAQYTDQVEQPAELPYCRCTWVFIYALRDLPPAMLTVKGREELTNVRAAIARFK